MAIHKLRLLAKEELVKNTYKFTFNKPENMAFIPGQYAGFTLINSPEKDLRGMTRRFSLASTPDEDTISIVTRIQNSTYKQVLQNLAIGSEIKFAGPTGTFTLHEEENIPAVLIAGGIGITPFYSMIKYATKLQQTRKITLFFGNTAVENAPLLQELQNFENKNPNFKMVATVENPQMDWKDEVGFITDKMISKYISCLTSPIYYVCGSPTMVTILQETLAEIGIQDERIKTEDFPGY